MLTIFTTPKPFHGHIAVIQRNAIASWARLQPRPLIILFGDEAGAAAVEFGAMHIPQVGRNEYGTPLVSAMFEEAERRSDSPLLCYVNADIILLSDVLTAAQRVTAVGQFLIVGRRWDLDLQDLWDFEEPGWEERLRTRAQRDGALHSLMGMDYFIYPRSFWGPLPPLAIGRTAWDNWLIYRARALGAPVIDATRAVTAIHQNHDYLHHPQGEGGVWQGAEAKRNQEMTGGPRYAFTLADVTHVLTPSGLRLALSMTHLKRRLITAPLFLPCLEPVVSPLIHVARLTRKTIARRTA